MSQDSRKGRMIVIEGADGSGKSTQANVLVQRLTAAGYDVEFIKFPQYDQPSSHFIRSYLNGEYGPASDIGPYTGALFYALDRYEAAPRIQKSLEVGKIIVADRYVASNMAHQGSKIADVIEQRSFFIWEDSLEFQLLGIPRPDLNIFLRMPPEMSYTQAGNQRQRTYTADSRDEHEKDLAHLKATAQAYDTLCELFPRDFKAVDAVEKGELLPIAELSNRIWAVVKPLLPHAPHKGRSLVLNLKTPITQKSKKPAAEQPKASVTVKAKASDAKAASLLAVNVLMSMTSRRLVYRSQWLAQSTKSEKLKWTTPPELPDNIAKQFDKAMERIAINHNRVAEKAGSQYSSLLVPLAARFMLEFPADDLQLEMKLSELPEIRRLASHYSNKLTSADSGAAKIRQFIHERLGKPSSVDAEALSLIEVFPRNEMDLLAPSLYPQSHLSQRLLSDEIDNWSYEQKAESLQLALNQSGSSPQKSARYSFDMLDDRLALMELYQTGLIKSLRLQSPTISFGIEMPPAVEDTDAETAFKEAVSASEELYGLLETSNWKELAGYACLSGHKLRFQFTTDAAALKKALRSVSSGAQARPTLKLMAEKIIEAQPIIGRWLLDEKSRRRTETSKLPSAAPKQRSRRADKRR